MLLRVAHLLDPVLIQGTVAASIQSLGLRRLLLVLLLSGVFFDNRSIGLFRSVVASLVALFVFVDALDSIGESVVCQLAHYGA